MMRRARVSLVALLAACGDAHEPDPAAASESAASACDQAAVEALAAELRDASPIAQPALVEARLGEACRLAPAIASFFALANSAQALRPPETDVEVRTPMQQANEALATICPSVREVKRAMMMAPGEQRMGLLYDGCGFERFGLADKPTWLRGSPGSATPFFAYQWLLDQGVAEERASTIARALLLVDRQQWALPDQTLPKVSHALAPVPPDVVVRVTRSEILVDEHRIAVVGPDGRVEAAALSGHLVGPLFDALSEEVNRARQTPTRTDDDPRPGLVLAIDARLSAEMLFDVLLTADKAGLVDAALVAETGPLEYGAVAVALHQPADPRASRFFVDIAGDGFTVSSSDGGEQHIDGDATKGEWDFAALVRAARRHAETHDAPTVASVTATGEVEYAVVVRTLATLRGEGCETRARCLLPDLVVRLPVDFDELARLAGLTGTTAGSGYGVSVASPAGVHPVPIVRQGRAKVTGSLDKDIVRRIIRAHINEVRHCYHEGLIGAPKLHGRVTIAFVIDGEGKVVSHAVESSTVADADVATCIAVAVGRWRFPRPTTGEVKVVAPFTLAPPR